MHNLIARTVLIAALAAGGATAADAQKMQAKPAASALTAAKGVQPLGDRIFTYVPASASASSPLIVLLPGHGEDADVFLKEFKGEADRRGAILLAIAPADPAGWTLKPDDKGGAEFGSDPARIDAALTAAFTRIPATPARTVILGFSDGGSYALSLGMANPKLFGGVVALSPRTAWLGGEIDTTQKLFIAHGMRDEVVTFKNSRDTIVPGLEKAGFKPAVRWFNAGHELDRRSIGEALDHVLGR